MGLVRRSRMLGAACAAIAIGFSGVVGGAISAPSASAAGQVLYGDADWLTAVNFYRTESGLPPVTVDDSRAAGTLAHARYMLATQTLTHDEIDGSPHWTAEGDWAGNHSNVALSGGSTPDRDFVELFMTAPYHALGILRPGVRTMAYSRADDASRPTYRSAAVLDILSGYDYSRVSVPITFPGNGSTVALDRFKAESPDPRDSCGWKGQTVGLPLLVMFPESAAGVSAVLSGPSGPIQTCVLSAANTTGTERALLAGDNAVIVMPRQPLPTGTFTATVTTSARTVTWTFGIDPSLRNAPPPTLPDTVPTAASSRFDPLTPVRLADSRLGQGIAGTLAPGSFVRLQVTGNGGVPAGATAVAVNVTAVNAQGPGYLTVYPCTPSVPEVSTVNYDTAQVVPNAAVIPLDSSGGLCVYSPARVDVIVDAFGVLTPNGSSGYRPLAPARLADTRTDGTGRVRRGETRHVVVRGRGGISAGAAAVVLNVTAVGPGGSGYVTADPCAPTPPTVSNLNLSLGDDRPNLVIVPVSATGEICLTVAETDTDLIVDVAGELTTSATTRYTPLAPIRLVDTRSGDARLNAGTAGARLAAKGGLPVRAAGVRGAPSAAAAMVNVTVTQTAGDGYLTVYPCGTAVPETSSLNYRGGQTTANAAVALLGSGQLCTWSFDGTHVIVDLVGVWS